MKGAVIVPAHNEAAVIERTLRGLSGLAVAGEIDLVVACNGCTDDTAARASAAPGVRVLEVAAASKTGALNGADAETGVWPRLYLDADIEIDPAAVRAVFGALSGETPGVLAARPARHYDLRGVSPLVRCYYRTRARIPALDEHLWGAGAYAVGAAGHARFGAFPEVIADDFWIDQQFDRSEIAIVDCPPVAVRPPRTAAALLATLTRVYGGNKAAGPADSTGSTGEGVSPTTIGLRQVLGTARGPRTLLDALAYAGFAVAGRIATRRRQVRWARDESSRVGDARPSPMKVRP